MAFWGSSLPPEVGISTVMKPFFADILDYYCHLKRRQKQLRGFLWGCYLQMCSVPFGRHALAAESAPLLPLSHSSGRNPGAFFISNLESMQTVRIVVMPKTDCYHFILLSQDGLRESRALISTNTLKSDQGESQTSLVDVPARRLLANDSNIQRVPKM